MVQISVSADGDEVVEVSGDGLIIATPSGSTAHNLAAGGPILEPTASSVILTPICPHTLTYRPLTMAAERRIELRLRRANKSTTVVIDGRTIKPFREGDCLRLTRYAADFLLVRNPSHSEWHALRHKLKWGELPNFRR
jgi:NAD+ kinase